MQSIEDGITIYHFPNNDVLDVFSEKIWPNIKVKKLSDKVYEYSLKKKNKSFISLWGTGKPKRELLYTDDLANLVIEVMSITKKKFKLITGGDHMINIGSGNEYSINSLAKLIAQTIGFKGKILFDKNKLDGAKRKFLDTDRQKKLKIYPKIKIKEGLKLAYNDYIKNIA